MSGWVEQDYLVRVVWVLVFGGGSSKLNRDRATDAVDWMLSDVVDEPGLDRRIDWLARNVPAVEPARVRAWCQAFAVIVAASMLARRDDDPVGAFLLR